MKKYGDQTWTKIMKIDVLTFCLTWIVFKFENSFIFFAIKNMFETIEWIK